ncbi:MAG: GNAT family N-acetyltransferase, partial [Bacteroidetes bacterium]|nr:GNAT family N-acetyltransferase [Bacteroidota bacterium]
MLQPNFSPFPELQTERLSLRHLTHADAEALFALRSNPGVMQYIDRPLAQSVEDVAKLIAVIENNLTANDGITWSMCLKGSTRLIGTIGLWRMDKENHRAEIGYMIHPEQQGKGLTYEALQTVLDYGFSVMRLHSVEGNVNPGNKASIRVLEKCGFVQEAWF